MTGLPVLLAILLLQAISLPGQTPNNTVEIQVGDRYGAIIPDAQILVAGSQGGAPFSTRTNADGKATFELPNGEFDMLIQSQGFCPQKRTVNVDGQSKTIRAELKIDTCPGPCQLSCATLIPVAGNPIPAYSTATRPDTQPALRVIVEDQTGVHVSLALIRVLDGNDVIIKEVFADKFGEATVSLDPGSYVFQVSVPGFMSSRLRTYVSPGLERTIKVEIRPGDVGNAPLVAENTQPLKLEHLVSSVELFFSPPELLSLPARNLSR
jgi:hypothetical protein